MTTQKRLTNRVLLVGWQGVDWSTLQTSIQAKGLPSLAALLHSGVSRQLAAPAPRVEASLWTSLLTGQRAHKHDILHTQQPLEGDLGSTRVARTQVRTATLGAILSASGLTVHQVGWPVSHPVEPLRGITVSDRFAREGRAESVGKSGGWPWTGPPAAASELFARRCAPGEVEEVALAQLVPVNLVAQPELGRLQQICRTVLAESLTVFRTTKWCMQCADWDVTLCAFPAIARLRESLTSTLSRNQFAELGQVVLAGCYEHLDMLLGQLVASAGEDATVVLVGMRASPSPQPGLVLRIPAVAGGTPPTTASLLDLVPTLLTMLGIPVGSDMDGQVWSGLLSGSDGATAVAPRYVETWDTCIHRPEDSVVQPTTAVDKQLAPTDPSVQHLLELGYEDPLDVARREQAELCGRESARNRALSLLDAGLVEEAVAQLTQLKSEFPYWPSPYELLAETYLQLHQNDLAEKELEFLVHNGAESALLYRSLGQISLERREIDEALKHFHVAERIAPELRRLQFARGSALLRQRNYQSAEKAFQKSLEVDGPTAAALDGLATCNLGNSRYEEAVDFALAALEQDMNCARAHYHLALALIQLNRLLEAKRAFESSVTVDPGFVAPLRWLARLSKEYLSQPEQEAEYRRRGNEIIRRRRHRALIRSDGA